MNYNELVPILKELAEKDLSEGSDIYDHPCIVAIRLIDRLAAELNAERVKNKLDPITPKPYPGTIRGGID